MSYKWRKTLIWISCIAIVAMAGAAVLPDYSRAYAMEKNQPKPKELTHLRTAHSKTFVDPVKKQYRLEAYLEPIHFRSQGQWKTIDNRVKKAKKGQALGKNLTYINGANRYRVGFAPSSRANKLVRFQLGKTFVDFGLSGQPDAVKPDIDENRVTYPEVYPETDLVYYADHTGIKEEWVLKKYQGKHTFSMTLNTRGVTPKKQKDGSVDFVDADGNTRFSVPRPFMVDENLRSSDEVELEIREEKGKTHLDLKADEDWLKDPDRAYPVRIDPSLSIQGVGETFDTFVGDGGSETDADTNFGSRTFLTTGNNPDHGISRSLLRFDLKPVLSGAKITSARLRMQQVLDNGHTETVNLHSITEDWDSMEATWNNQPEVGEVLDDTDVSGPDAYTFDLTDQAREWYRGETANYGVELRLENEENDRKSYRSSDYATDPEEKPKLTIEYEIEPIGKESFWTTAAGSNVNTFNGNFFLCECSDPDVEMAGRGELAKILRAYNSRSDGEGIFGPKWTSNLEQSLSDSGDGPVLYTDADGTPHTFTPNGDGTYEAPGGIYLELSKKKDGTYALKRQDQTVLTFDPAGRLTALTDDKGNQTVLQYTDGKPSVIVDASDREVTLEYNEDGRVAQVTDPADRTVEYAYDTDGHLTQVSKKDADGDTLASFAYGYDSQSRITSVTDPNGNQRTVTYDDEGRVEEVSQPVTVDGESQTATTRLNYDTTNRLTRVTDPKGTDTLYQHNAYGNVIQQTQDPNGLNYKQTFEYDDQNQLIGQKDANANAENRDATYDYEYDDNGNLTRVTQPEGETSTSEYDENNNKTEETDPEGHTTTHEYDQENNPTSSTDAATKSSAEKHDDYGNVTRSTTPMSPGDNQARNGGLEYDRNDNNWPDHWYAYPSKDAVTWADSGLAVNGLTLGTKSLRITDPGETTLIGGSKFIPYNSDQAYFASGYVQTENAKGKAGIQAVGYDADGNITKRIYGDELSGTEGPERLHAVVEPEAFPEETTKFRIRAYVVGQNGDYSGTYTFDGLQVEADHFGAYNLVENGEMERNDDPVDDIPDRWYLAGDIEEDDKLVDESHAGQQSVQLIGSADQWKTLRQDIDLTGKAGAVFTVSGFSKVENPDPKGNIYGYIVETYRDGSKQETFTFNFDKTESHDWQHRTAEIETTKDFDHLKVFYEYSDQSGTAWFDTAKVIPESITTQHAYDSKGNYETQTTDPEGRRVEKAHDSVGNVTGETRDGDTTRYDYDGLDRLTGVTDAQGNTTAYERDANGNKTKVTNAEGHTTTYAYDERDQVTKVTDPLEYTTRFVYDLNGNQTEIRQPNGDTVGYEYNAADRQTAVNHNGEKRYGFDYDPNGNVTEETDEANGETTAFSYDGNNRLEKMSEPNSNETLFSYDGNDQVTKQEITAGSDSFSQTFLYNRLSQLTRIQEDGEDRAHYTYDEADRVAARKNGDGTTALYRYNGAGDLLRKSLYTEGGELLREYRYTYDDKGHQTAVETDEGTTKYEYNERDQLTKETRPDGTVTTFQYDQNGNRTSMEVTQDGSTETTEYTYDEADQLTDVNGTSYTHDKNGNLTDAGRRTYVYDAENRLTEVKDESGGTLASYTYRADGMRKTKTVEGKTIRYHYDQNKNVTYETDEDNNIVARYTYGPDNEPVSMTRDGKTYYYQLNGHGDVIALTDEKGQEVATYQYDAFGNVVDETGDMENPYRYAGYRYDEETGFYYLQSRYYNPEIGRFLTRDRFQGFEEEPLSQNRYTYVENNPVMGVDPDGYTRRFIKVTYETYYISNNTLDKIIGVSGAAGWIQHLLRRVGSYVGFGVTGLAVYLRYWVAGSNGVKISIPYYWYQNLHYKFEWYWWGVRKRYFWGPAYWVRHLPRFYGY
ncbi:DNRLRE domain-containing protein [Paludifilum halophilum]|uniref:DNRLRE domain-containing protein n=1 Tax=Paludifilum halophilum TaxID=1642702 RepID=A0A235B3M7_9BACL|nr:DNRLRE domain-containing protein [Paludifilum halophilum]OYD06916.1 hypothetical protein CHM34_13320 [Paludifilum halophilum]